MRIKEFTWRCRRDFYADYECEHCGHVENSEGYDDAYFHAEVIPKMKCKECGKTAGEDYKPLTPKYAEGKQV